ncbi:hypothetical protein [Variovorax saccharolyticus]|uniref:hypothetical protein n=1 Tax=Variovorax saccharolyticus TaxID=3053516 RepID=UPI00257548CA|nr:hypothetical protein [Variovorax sp. J31P216]MDM0030051.1 hypothetical protein [Variovorax sp. J31P216]
MDGQPRNLAPDPLPGGLADGGALARDYAFRPLDGALELALSNVASQARHTPQAVTAMLASALASLAGGEPSPDRVAALCVADRQWLMRELERILGTQQRWLSATCDVCRSRFDLQIDPAALPIKPAGSGFPQARVTWDGHEYLLRVPCGLDQAWLAETQDAGVDAARALAARLVQSVDGALTQDFDAMQLPDDWFVAVDQVLDDMAPAMATKALAACPECGQANTVALEPYGVLARSDTELLDDVHCLASHYHWSEREILALPRARRHDYLRRIDAARGLAQ